MTLSAEFSVNGDPDVQEHIVAYGATVTLAALSMEFNTIAWSIVSGSKSGATAPTITPSGSPTGAVATFPQVADPSDGLGRAWIVKCLQTDSGGASAVSYRVVGTENTNGYLPLCADELNYRDATHGWSQVINVLLATASSSGSLPEIITEATTARTLGLTDANDYIRCTSGSATDITVPLNATAAFAVGDSIAIRQAGAGQVTIVATGGVTINTPYTLKARAQHCTIVLTKVATNTWDLTGDLATS